MGRLVWPLIFVLAIIFTGYTFASLNSEDQLKTNNILVPELLAPYSASEKIPDLEVIDKDGNKLKLRDLPNDSLLNFWSSNCGECQTELKDFTDYSKSKPNFNPILINTSEDQATALSALESWGVTFKTYFDPTGEVFKAFSATMPATYYIKDSKIVYFFPGRISTKHLDALFNK